MCLRVSVKCSTYGFGPAKCMRKTILEEINLHLFLKYHFPTVAFGTFCKCESVWSWFPFRTDGLLKIYSHHKIPLKIYIWFHYQPKRMTVFCKSPFHGRTSIYEEYIECILVLVIRVFELQKTNSGKWKIPHAIVLAIFWDNCRKILKPNLNGEHFEKIDTKTAITYNDNLENNQFSV